MYTGHHISGDQIFGKFTNICPHAKKKNGLEFQNFVKVQKLVGRPEKKPGPILPYKSAASVASVISKF